MGSYAPWPTQCCGSPGQKQLISANTIGPAWRRAAGASYRPRAVQVATASAFGRPASRASAIPSLPPHRPSSCCRQGGSTGEVSMLCASHSLHVIVGNTSVAQVRSTVSPPLVAKNVTPDLLSIRAMPPLRWLSLRCIDATDTGRPCATPVDRSTSPSCLLLSLERGWDNPAH